MPSGSNKLDYLSKYMDGGGDGSRGDGRKEKKKKKKRSREKKTTLETIQLQDADEVDVALLPVADGDDDDDDEEEPVVVNDAELLGALHPGDEKAKGTWVVETHGVGDQDEPPRRRRHDSFSSNNSSHKNGRKRRRHDSSSDEQAPRRRRHDSDASEEESPGPSRRRQRHDSDDASSSSSFHPVNAKVQASRRKRHDSSSSESDHALRHRRRHDSSPSNGSPTSSRDSDQNNKNNKESMVSGHIAGLQRGDQFARTEAQIQQSRRKQAALMVDKHGTGETVYRDKQSGARVEKPQPDNHGKQRPQLTPEQQRLLNMGNAQLQQQALQQQEFARIQQADFARRADDEELETARRNEIRADDPMAAYALRRQQQQQPTTRSGGNDTATTTMRQRPVYKGPPPKPNRFNIPPGHRWDAKDRGNGFEDRLLAQQYSAQHKREQAYRYSAADM